MFGLAAVVLTVFVLGVAESVVLPLALALLVAFIATPIVTLVQRTGLGRVPAVMVTLVVAGAATLGVALMVGSQLRVLLSDLPDRQLEIEAKIDGIRSRGGALSRAVTMIQEIAQGGADAAEGASGAPTTVARIEEGSPLGRALEPVLLVLHPIATAGLVLVLAVFVLIGREELRSRLMATLGRNRLIATVRVLEEASRRTGRYLLLQLLLNAAMGAVFGIGLALMGVPYAPLWAFLTALLRFIPYVGAWVSMLLPLSISFATTPGWDQPLLILGYFLVIDLVVANMVEPLVFGHHTGVSPIALLVAAAFWAWVWGPIGLLISTPLTVCLVVLGQHVPRFRSLSLLLGDQPGLPPPMEYFQRVLTDGSAAGIPLVAAASARSDAARAFDEVLIPALSLTRADSTAGALTREEVLRIRQSTAEAIGPAVAAAPAAPVTPAPAVGEGRLIVLATPAHDELEELPLQMMAAVLTREGHQVEVLTTQLLPSDVVRRVAAVGATTVVISILPPGGLPQAAYLCRLLRRQYPDLLIITARWGRTAGYDRLLVRLRRMGASYLTTSLVQTCAQIRAAGKRVTAP